MPTTVAARDDLADWVASEADIDALRAALAAVLKRHPQDVCDILVGQCPVRMDVSRVRASYSKQGS